MFIEQLSASVHRQERQPDLGDAGLARDGQVVADGCDLLVDRGAGARAESGCRDRRVLRGGSVVDSHSGRLQRHSSSFGQD